MDSIGIRSQFVENLRPAGELLVVLSLFVEHADGRAVAPLGIAEFLFLPVEVAELQQQNAFLHARPCGFLIAFLIGADGFGGVVVEQVDVAHGIVDLIEKLLVVVVGSHAFQPADGLFRPARCHHLSHGDARIEVQFIGRVQAHHFLIGFISQVAMSEGSLELSEQEPFPGSLFLAHLVLDHLAEIGDGFLVVTGMDVVVSIGVVPFLCGMPVDAVAAHVANDVLRIVEPLLLDIALGQPCPCFAVDGGLCLVEPAHVGECGSGFVESPFVELRPAHEHPRLPEHGVVFASAEPFDVLGRLTPVFGPLRAFADAMQLDGFLAFLDGRVEIAGSERTAAFVSYGIERDDLSVIVLVALLLGQ